LCLPNLFFYNEVLDLWITMQTHSYPGKFIVFEGPEGSGKTTQVPLLVKKLQQGGHQVAARKEPTEDGIFGRLVRFIYTCQVEYHRLAAELEKCFNDPDFQLHQDNANPTHTHHLVRFKEIAREVTEGNYTNIPTLIQLGMTFDGKDHLQRVIMPALAQGTQVVTDRWRISTPAYAAADNTDWRRFLALQFDVLGAQFIAPDAIVFLDVPVDLGLQRTFVKQGGRKEFFDDPDRMKKIQAAYYQIFEDPTIKGKTKVYHIDGSQNPDIVHAAVWNSVQSLFN